MTHDENRMQQGRRCWVGLDWGNAGHAVSVVDDARHLLGQFKMGASLEELEQLPERLGRFGEVAGIAIEATCHPVVTHLFSAGLPIYPVNPKVSKSWRECNSVAGAKNDERDGLVLAMELAVRHASLRRLKQDESTAQLAGLCAKLRDLVSQRTALVQRLQATLGQYYRGGLDFFSEWTSPAAWRFVKRFPRPEVLAQAKKETLIRFLKANRIGLRPVWLERIEARHEATRWPKPANCAALEVMALATVAQLQALQPYIDKLDKLIAQAARDLPHARLLRSLPGAGDRLAPALATITTVQAAETEGLEGIRCVSGVAPVEFTSGNRRRVRVRRRCNKYWRNTLHMFANSSKAYCAWARAFYDLHRAQGDKHATALRKLADKWLKIINSMLKTGQPYDDARYVESLKTRQSPVYLRLCGKTCG